MAEDMQSWDPFALLLIDVQKDFWTDEMTVAFPDFDDNVASLLALCREQGIDVLHLRAQFKEDRSDWMARYRLTGEIPCVEGTTGAEVSAAAEETNGEPVIIKQTFDGFLKSDLERWLRDNDKRFVLVAGLVTSVCVLLTAAAAAQRGYLVSVIEDCCADKPEAHVHTLERYPFVFDVISVGGIVARRPTWLDQLSKLKD